MTGAFVRVRRDGRWQNVEIDRLTDMELHRLEDTLPDDGWKWAKFLAAWIRDHARDCDAAAGRVNS